MIDTLARLQQYIRNLGDIHPDINQVVIGDSEQILSVDRSSLQYPVLWMETPRIKYQSGFQLQQVFDFSILILANVSPDAWPQQQYYLDKTLNIMTDLVTQLREDNSYGNISLDNITIQSDPVLGYGHDHDYGWRANVSIMSVICDIPSTYKYPTDNAPSQLASFAWINNNAGDFNSLQIANTSDLDDVVTTAWTYQIDDGTVQAGMPPIMSGAGSYMLITLTLTTATTTRTASALISSARNRGESVPYLIDKTFG